MARPHGVCWQARPMSARIARLCPPGPWWYVALCVECRWVSLDWKHKDQAEWDRDNHNDALHPPQSGRGDRA
jgi:hypothetical protein